MPVILKTNPLTAKPSSKIVRISSNRSPAPARKQTARKNSSKALGLILKKPAEASGEGKCGFDCLETAARVIEIHYPEMPIAKDMRRLVDEIVRLRD